MNIFTPTEYKQILQDPIIKEIATQFENWNRSVLPLMNTVSLPYIAFQQALAEAMIGKVGSVVLDYGCGSGSLSLMLLQNGAKDIQRIIGVDLDKNILKDVPITLQKVSYKGELDLINSISMVPLPLKPREVDTIISGLGGITYSGYYFNSSYVNKSRAALAECLKDCNRVLKPGGYLGFSSLVPNPYYKEVTQRNIAMLLKNRKFKALWTALTHASEMDEAFQFMRDLERAGLAHHLTPLEWQKELESCGFTLVDIRSSYAGQGLVMVARKGNPGISRFTRNPVLEY